MDIIAGKSLQFADGSTKTADDFLANKDVVCFYFSAHWCPPCRQFTPILKEFYEESAEAGLEVIFISSDRSAEDTVSYMKESHGNWPALAHGSEPAQQLKQRYGITGIPSLIVVNRKTGEMITKEGRAAVQSKGPGAVKDWGL